MKMKTNFVDNNLVMLQTDKTPGSYLIELCLLSSDATSCIFYSNKSVNKFYNKIQ